MMMESFCGSEKIENEFRGPWYGMFIFIIIADRLVSWLIVDCLDDFYLLSLRIHSYFDININIWNDLLLLLTNSQMINLTAL